MTSEEPIGIKNLGATCYLNVLLQSLHCMDIVMANLDDSDFSKKIINKDVNGILNELGLPNSPYCSHEAWLKIVDHLSYIKEVFEIKFLDDNKIIQTQTELVGNPDVDNMSIIQYPFILTIVSNISPRLNFIKYKLISIVRYTGGHYDCYCKKNNTWYYCNDSYIKKENPPTSKTNLIYYYELLQ